MKNERKPLVILIDNLDAVAEIAKETVSKLVADIGTRTPLGQVWNTLDPETTKEIARSWESLLDEGVRRQLLTPEDLAMLQALYSRSPKSVVDHLAKLRQGSSGKFMDSYYVGYGHASIGDCGTTTVFIEDVPMLAAKAIQDWPLYSGQEASTRYMDFSNATFANPLGTPAGEAVQERWRRFYIESSPLLIAHLTEKYPRKPEEDEKTYERAISARCFDVMRAFLPAGAHTSLSWTTNLRQANDKLRWLCQHPDPSIARLGTTILGAAREKYTHSFGQASLKTNREGGQAELVDAFVRDVMANDYFLGPGDWPGFSVRATVDAVALARHKALLANRPRGAEIPPWFADLGTIQSEFLLDFGSYRDLQRHRAGTIRMPMLTTRFGFHWWYLDEMPSELRAQALALIAEQAAAIEALGAAPVIAQNYVAMGFMVQCRVTQSIPAFVYRMELRSGKTIHPTLRSVIHEEIGWFQHRFPDVALHVDLDPDSWTIRRGRQTIEAR